MCRFLDFHSGSAGLAIDQPEEPIFILRDLTVPVVDSSLLSELSEAYSAESLPGGQAGLAAAAAAAVAGHGRGLPPCEEASSPLEAGERPVSLPEARRLWRALVEATPLLLDTRVAGRLSPCPSRRLRVLVVDQSLPGSDLVSLAVSAGGPLEAAGPGAAAAETRALAAPAAGSLSQSTAGLLSWATGLAMTAIAQSLPRAPGAEGLGEAPGAGAGTAAASLWTMLTGARATPAAPAAESHALVDTAVPGPGPGPGVDPPGEGAGGAESDPGDIRPSAGSRPASPTGDAPPPGAEPAAAAAAAAGTSASPPGQVDVPDESPLVRPPGVVSLPRPTGADVAGELERLLPAAPASARLHLAAGRFYLRQEAGDLDTRLEIAHAELLAAAAVILHPPAWAEALRPQIARLHRGSVIDVTERLIYLQVPCASVFAPVADRRLDAALERACFVLFGAREPCAAPGCACGRARASAAALGLPVPRLPGPGRLAAVAAGLSGPQLDAALARWTERTVATAAGAILRQLVAHPGPRDIWHRGPFRSPADVAAVCALACSAVSEAICTAPQSVVLFLRQLAATAEGGRSPDISEADLPPLSASGADDLTPGLIYALGLVARPDVCPAAVVARPAEAPPADALPALCAEHCAPEPADPPATPGALLDWAPSPSASASELSFDVSMAEVAAARARAASLLAEPPGEGRGSGPGDPSPPGRLAVVSYARFAQRSRSLQRVSECGRSGAGAYGACMVESAALYLIELAAAGPASVAETLGLDAASEEGRRLDRACAARARLWDASTPAPSRPPSPGRGRDHDHNDDEQAFERLCRDLARTVVSSLLVSAFSRSVARDREERWQEPPAAPNECGSPPAPGEQ
ncbi:hypothetical protein H696_01377 [Fonticula alba]|uniref:Uncharacterized protein n=1 Tax=Fonticula alba TaxID=691883 RepID=A0A058ZDH8_FONAL|nr:hypothetical protein H696_01377 [Fonticula alba]KCV71968.1 hypothetical protein H696_01377 [Fonticula alba]|eukprot:XP_009493546.1 hypothetical protein H696_01377 [Fonticula alba]